MGRPPASTRRCSIPPGGTTMRQDGSVLISARELAHRLQVSGEEGLRLLDVRWRLAGPPARADFEAGHLPGAVFVDLDRDLAAPPGRAGRHPLPDVASFGAAMRRAGVSSGTPVVCYDERDGTSAARCWWVLSYYGHPSVSVLDGGLAAWESAGGALTTEISQPPPGDFSPAPGHLPLIDATEAASLARSGTLLDARAVERYRGDTEPIDPVAGHVPGALSAPTSGNVGPDGRFLDPDQLERRFAELGVTSDRPVGVYCGSGVTAAH